MQRKAIARIVGRPTKRAIRLLLLGCMWIGVLITIPGLLLGMACDKVVNALDESPAKVETRKSG